MGNAELLASSLGTFFKGTYLSVSGFHRRFRRVFAGSAARGGSGGDLSPPRACLVPVESRTLGTPTYPLGADLGSVVSGEGGVARVWGSRVAFWPSSDGQNPFCSCHRCFRVASWFCGGVQPACRLSVLGQGL